MGARLLSFRGQREGVLSHPEARSKRPNVTVPDGDFDFTEWIVHSVRVPGEDKNTDPERGPNRPGEITYFLTHVDRNGEGHEWVIPSKVVDAMVRHRDGLNREHWKAVSRVRVNGSRNIPALEASLEGGA